MCNHSSATRKYLLSQTWQTFDFARTKHVTPVLLDEEGQDALAALRILLELPPVVAVLAHRPHRHLVHARHREERR